MHLLMPAAAVRPVICKLLIGAGFLRHFARQRQAMRATVTGQKVKVQTEWRTLLIGSVAEVTDAQSRRHDHETFRTAPLMSKMMTIRMQDE